MHLFGVMAGLVRACLGLSRPSTPFSLKARKKDVDARDKPGQAGHDSG
jgi:hypothetical protein